MKVNMKNLFLSLLFSFVATIFIFLSLSIYYDDIIYGNITKDCVIATSNKMEKRILVTITAYSPRKGETDDTPFTTASNKRVREGFAAISRDLEKELSLRFGDTIFIEGYGYFQFEDRMHKRKKKQVDIFMFDTKKALKFGKQKGYLIIER